MKPESKFWQEVKKNLTNISFTRLESWASAGVPDLLCYNKNNIFFTVELKVAAKEHLRLSPHQISFHVKHPVNSFILKKSLGPCSVKLYTGSQVLALANREPCAPIAESWPAVQRVFDSLSMWHNAAAQVRACGRVPPLFFIFCACALVLVACCLRPGTACARFVFVFVSLCSKTSSAGCVPGSWPVDNYLICLNN